MLRGGAAAAAHQAGPGLPVGLFQIGQFLAQRLQVFHCAADIVAFANSFTGADPIVDADGNGVFDLADIVAFVESFNAGCP